MARYDSLRVLLALATHRDMEILQFDVRTAFLYGELEEDIYMEVPEGLRKSDQNKRKVCKLQKSLWA